MKNREMFLGSLIPGYQWSATLLVAARYFKIAALSPRAKSPSTRQGILPRGLVALYSGLRCSFLAIFTITSSASILFNLQVQRL